MLVRSQKHLGGRIFVVDTAHVSSWEVTDTGTLFVTTCEGQSFRMGQFADQKDALNFLELVQVKSSSGVLFSAVPEEVKKDE